MKRICILAWGIVILANVELELLAQDSSTVEVQKQLEQAFEELDDENGNSGEQLIQFLEDLAANPININSADIAELLQVPGMNIAIANAIIRYRNQQPFENVKELLDVAGIGQITYNRMVPYVTIGGLGEKFRDQYWRKEYWTNGGKVEFLSRFQQNLEQQEGYIRPDSAGGYLGSPAKYYQRLWWQSNHLSMNLTQEKDAGERLSGPTDFDYNSWHVALRDNGRLKSLVIGDYSLSFGQGLVLWTGGAFGKGREVIETVSRNERGLRPYTSVQETDFFRGIAATFGEEIETTVFYSDRPRTASTLEGEITRYPSSSGFHRTASELARRNNMQQKTLGARIRYNTRFGLFGMSGYQTEFSNYVISGNERFDFQGSGNSVAGIDYRGLIGQSLIFGEIARSENGGLGGIIGMESSLDIRTELALSYRKYQNDFQSLLGDGFGESSSTQNEQGFYAGLRHQLSSIFLVSTYFDQYQFEGSSSEVVANTGGYDVLGLIEARFNRKLTAYLLLRNETKDDEYEIEREEGRTQQWVGHEKRRSIRAQVEYQVHPNVRWRSRGEAVQYQPAGGEWGRGFLMYQDIRIQLKKNLKIDTRFTLFDTESFDTRMYQYESDLRYVMSNTALSDQGQRWYIVIDMKPTPYVQLWAKYSITVIEDAQVLSSGLGEIQGNTRSFLGLQGRISLK